MTKKIPITDQQKPMILTPGRIITMVLDPSEITCPICEENSPNLIYAEKSQKNAILLCVEAAQRIQVRLKECPQCKLKVSYKDHDKHVFNFNDSLVISHRLLDRW